MTKSQLTVITAGGGVLKLSLKKEKVITQGQGNDEEESVYSDENGFLWRFKMKDKFFQEHLGCLVCKALGIDTPESCIGYFDEKKNYNGTARIFLQKYIDNDDSKNIKVESASGKIEKLPIDKIIRIFIASAIIGNYDIFGKSNGDNLLVEKSNGNLKIIKIDLERSFDDIERSGKWITISKENENSWDDPSCRFIKSLNDTNNSDFYRSSHEFISNINIENLKQAIEKAFLELTSIDSNILFFVKRIIDVNKQNCKTYIDKKISSILKSDPDLTKKQVSVDKGEMKNVINDIMASLEENIQNINNFIKEKINQQTSTEASTHGSKSSTFFQSPQVDLPTKEIDQKTLTAKNEQHEQETTDEITSVCPR